MEPDMITLKLNGELFGLCLPDNLDEKTIDSMLSKVKVRLLENI